MYIFLVESIKSFKDPAPLFISSQNSNAIQKIYIYKKKNNHLINRQQQKRKGSWEFGIGAAKASARHKK